MRKPRLYIISVAVLIVSLYILILMKGPTPMLLPAQEVDLSGKIDGVPISDGFLFIQEITSKKEYIYGLAIAFSDQNRINTNDNVMFVLDDANKMLFNTSFNSNTISKPKYYSYNFNKTIHVGKGHKFYLCLYTPDGTAGNCIAVASKVNGILGRIYASKLINNDIASAFQNKSNGFSENFGVKTYESDFHYASLIKGILILLVILIAVPFAFPEKYKKLISSVNLVPEKVYPFLAIPFGLVLIFLTPPGQVPDEKTHFVRSYQISEGNIYHFDKTVPASILNFDTSLSRLTHNISEKTNRAEIKNTGKTKLDSHSRKQISILDYVIPYLPQAAGITFARIFSDSVLILLYAGRLFNLLISVILIYFAIRIIPVGKWVFFLLGMMPMALFMSSSLSYDGSLYSLSFLIIAILLRLVLDPIKKTGSSDLVILFILAAMLTLCKPPYFILASLFLLIPVKKIGSVKRYILLIGCLILTIALSTQIWGITRKLFEPKQTTAKVKTVTQPTAGIIKSVSTKTIKPKPDPSPKNVIIESPFNASKQKEFILSNLPRYAGIIINTMLDSDRRYNYLLTFVGLFAWVDTPLPDFVIYIYLCLLIFTALSIGNNTISINWKHKLVFLAIIVTCFLLIETGLYLYSNEIGAKIITAVQGRYFIPFAPLLFLLFYNIKTEEKLNMFFSTGSFKPQKIVKPQKVAKSQKFINAKKQIKTIVEKQTYPLVFTKTLQLLIIATVVFSFVCTVYVILVRFYLVTI
ncbi:MAG: DUF2142 domain-containing protein [Bacteroidetes bacterium]|nr:DUF2142 domain-containing protein [Bacteroidota bacterium]